MENGWRGSTFAVALNLNIYGAGYYYGCGTSPAPRCPEGSTNIKKCTNFQLKMMNWTQVLRSALFRNSIKATMKDLATTNKA